MGPVLTMGISWGCTAARDDSYSTTSCCNPSPVSDRNDTLGFGALPTRNSKGWLWGCPSRGTYWRRARKSSRLQQHICSWHRNHQAHTPPLVGMDSHCAGFPSMQHCQSLCCRRCINISQGNLKMAHCKFERKERRIESDYLQGKWPFGIKFPTLKQQPGSLWGSVWHQRA